MENSGKITMSILFGTLATITQQYALILILVITAIIFDVVTGLIKSKVASIAWGSHKGMIGFWKKFGLLVAFMFGIFMDILIPITLQVVNIELPFNCPFGLVVGVYIILNESISICENIFQTNPNAIPKWVLKLLKSSRDEIDKKEK